MERKIKRILITGAAGLIGSNLAHYILDNKKDVELVIGVDNLSGGWKENLPRNDRFKFFEVDTTSDDIQSIFNKHQPDVVYHCAAYAAECLSPFIRRFNYRNNLEATANIVNNCIKYDVQRLVFTSSMAVYGIGSVPFGEDDRPAPVDPYGIAKYACEQDIMVAGVQHKLDWCIIRPHNVYGKRQIINDPYRNFIGICMYKILVGDPITVYGDGLQERAFSYIDDSLEPLWKAGTDKRASRQIINLGGIREYTISETAETVVTVANDLNARGWWTTKRPWTQTPQIIHLPPRDEVRLAYSTSDRSIDLLDFEHKTDLADGVHDMWLWVLDEPPRERVKGPLYEVEKGLYPYWELEALVDGYYTGPEDNSVTLLKSGQ